MITGISFLGCGRMASALARGFVAAGKIYPHKITVYDVNPAACKALAETMPGIQIAHSIEQAAEGKLVFLCVKPGHVADCLKQANDALADSLLVSIAAGVTLDTLRQLTPQGTRTIRVMPNTPALVGKGASAIAPDDSVEDEEIEVVRTLLEAVGTVHVVNEDQMDAVTAVSGSGPAFFYLFIEALAEGGVTNGLNSQTALELAAQTALGAAQMILETGQSPQELREMVTSPGGTTLAGLECLKQHTTAAGIAAAVDAAAARSRELGNAK